VSGSRRRSAGREFHTDGLTTEKAINHSALVAELLQG